jgi:catechol 2,3-dioxygenase
LQRLFTENLIKIYGLKHAKASSNKSFHRFGIIIFKGREIMDKYHQKDAIKITEIELVVRNLKSMTEYYTNSLGFSVIYNDNKKTILSVDGINPIITLIEDKKAVKRGKTTGLYHVAILLPSRGDLGLFLRHVINHQIPISGAADHGVSEALYFQDPEDNGIEVYTDKDDSTWYDEFGTLVMYTADIDYSGIYYAAKENETFTSLPIGTTLGHLHLSVSSLESARKFYIEAIGFDVAFDKLPRALFVGSMNYHHHLGLNTWMGDKKPSPLSNGLKSFVITYPKCEEIDAAMKKISTLNLPVIEIENGYQTTDFDGNTVFLRLVA